jgi:hypothetical protein
LQEDQFSPDHPEDVLGSATNLISGVDTIVERLETWPRECVSSYVVGPGSKINRVAPIVTRPAGK